MSDKIARIYELAAALHGLAMIDLTVTIKCISSTRWCMYVTAQDYSDPLLDSTHLTNSVLSQEALEELVIEHLKELLTKKRDNMFVQLQRCNQALLEDEIRSAGNSPGNWNEAMIKSPLPIEEAGFSMRALKALEPLKVQTLGELCCLSEKDLVAVKFFGRKSLKEVKEVLAARGLCLRPEKGGVA